MLFTADNGTDRPKHIYHQGEKGLKIQNQGTEHLQTHVKIIYQSWAKVLVSSQITENTCKSTRQHVSQDSMTFDKTIQDA